MRSPWVHRKENLTIICGAWFWEPGRFSKKIQGGGKATAWVDWARQAYLNTLGLNPTKGRSMSDSEVIRNIKVFSFFRYELRILFSSSLCQGECDVTSEIKQRKADQTAQKTETGFHRRFLPSIVTSECRMEPNLLSGVVYGPFWRGIKRGHPLMSIKSWKKIGSWSRNVKTNALKIQCYISCFTKLRPLENREMLQ